MSYYDNLMKKTTEDAARNGLLVVDISKLV